MTRDHETGGDAAHHDTPRHFIDGRCVPAHSGQTIANIDPSSEDLAGYFARGNATDIHAAVEAAERARHGPWREMAPAERGAVLFRLADAVAACASELAAMETRDVGKPVKEAVGDMAGVVATLRYNAGAADKLEGATIPLGPGFVDFTVLEPAGVTAHIVPWNFPLGMAARSVAPALAAGCTVVLKPAEHSASSALRFAELAAAAGLPPGVFNVVSGTGVEAGEPLVCHPLVRSVTFTGSAATGRRIMAAASAHLTPVVLELGGKNAIIVFADADLDRLVEDVADGAFGNSGQVCSSCSRILCERSIAAQLAERLCERARKITVGRGIDDPDIGPLVSRAQYDKVTGHVRAARAAGARLVAGGGRPKDLPRGFFFEPTIFADVDPALPISREEVFGPVLTVASFDRADEALALANATAYGLVAGIYTRDISRALTMAARLETGSVWINGWFIGGQQAPTGGVKNSGIGRERGLPGLRNYVSIKNIGIRL